MVFFTLHVWFARVQCSEISKLLKCAGRISGILNAIVTMQLFGEIPFVALWEKCCVLISSKKLLSLIGKLDKFQIVVLPKTRSFGWNRISFTFVGILSNISIWNFTLTFIVTEKNPRFEKKVEVVIYMVLIPG